MAAAAAREDAVARHRPSALALGATVKGPVAARGGALRRRGAQDAGRVAVVLGGPGRKAGRVHRIARGVIFAERLVVLADEPGALPLEGAEGQFGISPEAVAGHQRGAIARTRRNRGGAQIALATQPTNKITMGDMISSEADAKSVQPLSSRKDFASKNNMVEQTEIFNRIIQIFICRWSIFCGNIFIPNATDYCADG